MIASGSTTCKAQVILNEGEERWVKSEDMVLIENKAGGRLLGICREGFGSNECLRIDSYSPTVAYARAGGEVPAHRENFVFNLEVLGELGWSVRENLSIIAPGSQVWLFDGKSNPMEHLMGGSPTVVKSNAFYHRQPEWQVPMECSYIRYHIGVYGSTGSGKSWLARNVLIPILLKSGYSIVILDWKGRDYTPHFSSANRVNVYDVALDERTVSEYLCNRMNYFGYREKMKGSLCQSLVEFIYQVNWRGLSSEAFRQHLRGFMEANIAGEGKKGAADLARFRRYSRLLSDGHVLKTMGSLTPEDLIQKAHSLGVVVVDMREAGTDEKLTLFLALGSYFVSQIEQDHDINVALLIDETPQYAPFKPEGKQADATELMIQLAALGRTYRLALVLLAQRMAGEIGVNAAVRGSLNTNLIGRLSPSDLEEAGLWLKPHGIEPERLLRMPVGFFYLVGKMNAVPSPLLITFQPIARY